MASFVLGKRHSPRCLRGEKVKQCLPAKTFKRGRKERVKKNNDWENQDVLSNLYFFPLPYISSMKVYQQKLTPIILNVKPESQVFYVPSFIQTTYKQVGLAQDNDTPLPAREEVVREDLHQEQERLTSGFCCPGKSFHLRQSSFLASWVCQACCHLQIVPLANNLYH